MHHLFQFFCKYVKWLSKRFPTEFKVHLEFQIMKMKLLLLSCHHSMLSIHSAMITNKIIWKIRFCFKMIGNGPKCAKIHIFQIFPWDFPMGVLKIEVYPMGQCMAFLISACCPDSKAVEILKIGWVCNSLPYLHMGLRDLTSTPY